MTKIPGINLCLQCKRHFLISPAKPLLAIRNRPIGSSLNSWMVLTQTQPSKTKTEMKTTVALPAKLAELQAKKFSQGINTFLKNKAKIRKATDEDLSFFLILVSLSVEKATN